MSSASFDWASSLALRGADPRRLAGLMDPGAAGRAAWRPEELGAILRHQLAAPLREDLAPTGPKLAEDLDRPGAGPGWSGASFADLLHAADPPLVLLEAVKRFAKAQRGPNAALPEDVAALLYYAAIAAAWARLGLRITNLDDDALRYGFGWSLGRDWVDEPTRELFLRALSALDVPPGVGRTPP